MGRRRRAGTDGDSDGVGVGDGPGRVLLRRLAERKHAHDVKGLGTGAAGGHVPRNAEPHIQR